MKTIATLRATLLLLYLCGCGSASDCQLGKANGNKVTIAHLRKYDVSESDHRGQYCRYACMSVAGLLGVVCYLTGSFHIQICNTHSH